MGIVITHETDAPILVVWCFDQENIFHLIYAFMLNARIIVQFRSNERRKRENDVWLKVFGSKLIILQLESYLGSNMVG